MNNDKSLFFLTLSLVCIWVILDAIYGKQYLDNFLNNLFGFNSTIKTKDDYIQENKENQSKLMEDYLKKHPDATPEQIEALEKLFEMENKGFM